MNKILTVVAFLFVFNIAYSQEYNFDDEDVKSIDTTNYKDNIYYGGGFGLQFGTITALELQPEISYKLHKYIYAGMGGMFSYYKDFRYDLSRIVYGVRPFTRLFLFSDFYLQGEYEILDVPKIDLNTGYYSGERTFVTGVIGGIGYRQRAGKRFSLLTTLLFNFTISSQTPYLNPMYRISILF